MSRRLGARSATSPIALSVSASHPTPSGTDAFAAAPESARARAPRLGRLRFRGTSSGEPPARRRFVRGGVRGGVAATAAASLIGMAALAGCASGSDALTNAARPTINSVSGAVGTITLRNVYVAGPVEKGESAQVISAVFNGGVEEDTLVAVSSDAAGGGRTPDPAVIKPGGGNIYIANGAAPTLTDVREKLLIGSAIPVTFTFEKAGSITLQVPVEPLAPGASGEPVATATPAETEQAEATEGGETAGAEATATPGGTASPTAAPTSPAATPATTEESPQAE